jgi:hypothetical protein
MVVALNALTQLVTKLGICVNGSPNLLFAFDCSHLAGQCPYSWHTVCFFGHCLPEADDGS